MRTPFPSGPVPRRASRLVAFVALLAATTAACGFFREARFEYFVSPSGSDEAPGTKDRPLATIQAAVDAASAWRPSSSRAVTIYLRAGVYRLTKSLRLPAEVSGAPGFETILRPFGEERVSIRGGVEIGGFGPVTDPAVLDRLPDEARGRVLRADLGAAGLGDFGTLRRRGFGSPIQPSAMELFYDGRAMTLARWPNEGWARIASVPDGPDGGRFVYEGDRPARWVRAGEIWLHGYWTWDWADSYERVAAIDARSRTISTVPPHGVYGYSAGRRFYALNLLEELDRPGEYYIDRAAGSLYFWPPDPGAGGRAVVSLLEEPLVVFDRARDVVLSGVTLEATRGAGIEIVGGERDVVRGCVLRNIGSVGASLGRLEPAIASRIYEDTLFVGEAPRRSGLDGCEISACGEGGVIALGGDRRTLEPGRNFVTRCEISDCGRWSRTYRAGVFLWGVGQIVSGNRIHDLPHTAVFLWGNDHLLELNEVFGVCLETGDAGAFYLGRDWTQRGTIIRHNYFHHLRGLPGGPGFNDVMAVYLDDWASGTTIVGNVFQRAGRSVMIGGGRDNRVENNVFLDGSPALHIDARGIGWAKGYFDGTDATLFKRWEAVQPDAPPYRDRYPELAGYVRDEPALPKGNRVVRNIFRGGRAIEYLDGVDRLGLLRLENNWTEGDPGFVDPERGDFRLRRGSPAARLGFEPIPMDRIGRR